MMALVLANDGLATQLPQASIMVRTGRHQIRGISTERTIPDPALMALQGRLERERVDMTVGSWKIVRMGRVVRSGWIDGPDPRGVIGGAGRKVADVGGKQDAVDVSVMG